MARLSNQGSNATETTSVRPNSLLPRARREGFDFFCCLLLLYRGTHSRSVPSLLPDPPTTKLTSPSSLSCPLKTGNDRSYALVPGGEGVGGRRSENTKYYTGYVGQRGGRVNHETTPVIWQRSVDAPSAHARDGFFAELTSTTLLNTQFQEETTPTMTLIWSEVELSSTNSYLYCMVPVS